MLPTSDAIRALAASFVTPERIIFPVRHHSPACAWQLQHLLANLIAHAKPAAILVEGPRGFTPMVPLLAHADAQMPLAIYTYAVQEMAGELIPARLSAYYPFCDYSPELVALRFALANRIPAQFIDLDFAEQCQIERTPEDAEAQSLLDERHFRRSRYLNALAVEFGCRNHEELWEHLFEVPAASRTLEQHMAELAAYCHLARCESNDADLTADGTLQREAEMAWHIREAVAKRGTGEGPVIAVVGGFHAVALPALLLAASERPSISRVSISDESSALIRYSFDRLDQLNGYAAGMTSPAWHQQLWTRMQKHDKAGIDAGARVRHEVALNFLFDIAFALRERHGISLPVPALAAAFEHTLRLAALRSRTAPAREDVLDAVTSCFIKGDADADGALVLGVATRLMSGNVMGKVPPGANVPPLVKDFSYRARRQRLRIDDSEPRKLALDIYRRAEHRLTSRLLHGLTLLAVPLAARMAGPDFVNGSGLGRLQEHWEYSYSAATEAALVEASVYGVTVPLAVATRFAARLDNFENGGETKTAKLGAQLLIHACVLGLHDHLPRVAETLRLSIAEDAAFESATAAASSLGLLWESREPLEARDLSELPALLDAAYTRAVYLGRGLQGPANDGAKIVEALSRLRELLVSEAGRALDASQYWHLVESLRVEHAAALIRGAAAGLLYAAGKLSEADLGVALDGHLNGLREPREAVSFLRGLLQTAREAAWQLPSLLRVLDTLLQQWDDAAFVATLPELRLAFAEMTPKETDRIAEAVAKLYGADDLGRLVHYDLSAEQLQANLALSAQLKVLLTQDHLARWTTA